MSTPRSTKRIQGQVQAFNNNVLTAQEGPLLLAYGATILRICGFAPTLRGGLVLTPEYRRFAVRADVPEDNAWTASSTVSTTAPYTRSFDLSAIGAVMFVQPAMGAQSATSNGDGFSVWQAFTNGTGQVVARQTVQIEPDVNSGQTAFIPLGKPFPALDLSGVMAAIVARDCSGNPAINFVTRTFDGDPTKPSGTELWSTTALLGTDKTFTTPSEDYNTGNMAFAPANTGWTQIGLRVPSGSFRATLDITLAAKY